MCIRDSCLNNKHKFPDIQNVNLIKNVQKGNKMNIWENLNIFTHNNSNLLIKEQIQIKTKPDYLFKTKIEAVIITSVRNTISSCQRVIQCLSHLCLNLFHHLSERYY